MPSLLEVSSRGLYCAQGDFYIDPWRPVPRAIITHAHSDHARVGSERYLCPPDGVGVARTRLGDEATIDAVDYGESLDLNGVYVSLHPAGHVLGSCQVRVEYAGEVWVASGDYKCAADKSCKPIEVVRCHTFISECTFGLPIYRWPEADRVLADLVDWWRQNQRDGRTSVVLAYSLGKAQRILAALADEPGPILVHGAVDALLPAYRAAGIRLPDTERAEAENAKRTRGQALVVAPPSADNTPWMRKFGPVSTAAASGWMQIRGMRRRRSVDRGFVLSDHADWDDLQRVIEATGAENIVMTHGYTGVMVRWLRERGLAARAIHTRFQGELDEDAPNEQTAEAAELVDASASLLPGDQQPGASEARNAHERSDADTAIEDAGVDDRGGRSPAARAALPKEKATRKPKPPRQRNLELF